MQKTAAHFPFLFYLVKSWKPRAKKIKYKLKDLAVDSKMKPSQLTAVITSKTKNPRLKTIDKIECALLKKEGRI